MIRPEKFKELPLGTMFYAVEKCAERKAICDCCDGIKNIYIHVNEDVYNVPCPKCNGTGILNDVPVKSVVNSFIGIATKASFAYGTLEISGVDFTVQMVNENNKFSFRFPIKVPYYRVYDGNDIEEAYSSCVELADCGTMFFLSKEMAQKVCDKINSSL